MNEWQVRRLSWQPGQHLSQEQLPEPVNFVRGAALGCTSGCAGRPLTVDLQPMEIRTFELRLASERSGVSDASPQEA